jgi:uncharacterized membrane protein
MVSTREVIDTAREGERKVLRAVREARAHRVNVGRNERIFSVGGGSALALLGIRRGGLTGLLSTGLGGMLVYRGVTGRCRAYEALGVDTARDRVEPEDYFERGVHVVAAHTVGKPPHELYQFWRSFENLPRFMAHVESVRVLEGNRSHWVATAPSLTGRRVEWDAEIINDEPDALIAWQSLPGADVHNAGSVRFVPAPGDRGTEVQVTIDYIPPAGQLGLWVAKLFGQEPQQRVKEDLRRFKRIMEAGEVPTTHGQPRGTCKKL